MTQKRLGIVIVILIVATVVSLGTTVFLGIKLVESIRHYITLAEPMSGHHVLHREIKKTGARGHGDPLEHDIAHAWLDHLMDADSTCHYWLESPVEKEPKP